MKSLFRLRKNYEETLKEMNNLRKKLEEKDDYIDTLEKQVNFAAQYNDKVTNNNCELVNKLAVSDRKNEENEKKIKDLEFCLEECKTANRKMTDIVKRTNIFKSQLEDMLLIRNKEGKMTIVDGKIQVNKKIDGVKCYEVIRLLG
jgi:hypothetical protein